MPKRREMIGQSVRFGVIGLGATLIHLSVGTVLAVWWLPVEAANRAAFACALCAGFWGHYKISFAGHGVPAHLAFCRYFVIAIIGFLFNESVLAYLVSINGVSPVFALACAVFAAAALSFVLSQRWVFQRRAE